MMTESVLSVNTGNNTHGLRGQKESVQSGVFSDLLAALFSTRLMATQLPEATPAQGQGALGLGAAPETEAPTALRDPAPVTCTQEMLFLGLPHLLLESCKVSAELTIPADSDGTAAISEQTRDAGSVASSEGFVSLMPFVPSADCLCANLMTSGTAPEASEEVSDVRRPDKPIPESTKATNQPPVEGGLWGLSPLLYEPGTRVVVPATIPGAELSQHNTRSEVNGHTTPDKVFVAPSTTRLAVADQAVINQAVADSSVTEPSVSVSGDAFSGAQYPEVKSHQDKVVLPGIMPSKRESRDAISGRFDEAHDKTAAVASGAAMLDAPDASHRLEPTANEPQVEGSPPVRNPAGSEPTPRSRDIKASDRPADQDPTAWAPRPAQQRNLELASAGESPLEASAITQQYQRQMPDGVAPLLEVRAGETGKGALVQEHRREIIDRIVRSMRINSALRDQEVNIKLEPKELGEVWIRVVSGPAGIAADFRVTNELVRGVVESSLQHLRRDMVQAGMRVAELSVGSSADKPGEGQAHKEQRPKKNPYRRNQDVPRISAESPGYPRLRAQVTMRGGLNMVV